MLQWTRKLFARLTGANSFNEAGVPGCYCNDCYMARAEQEAMQYHDDLTDRLKTIGAAQVGGRPQGTPVGEGAPRVQ